MLRNSNLSGSGYGMRTGDLIKYADFFQGNLWSNPKRRRDFYESFAISNGFDPLVPDHWAVISTVDIDNAVSSDQPNDPNQLIKFCREHEAYCIITHGSSSFTVS